MSKDADTGSPGWTASFFMQTTEDMAKAVVAAATAATATRSPRPSVIFSSNDDYGDGKLKKLQQQFSRVLKGFSPNPPEVKGLTYNPEVLTSQKRQWANIQVQYLDHRSLKEPTNLFESLVVVGLHPHCDLQVLQRQYAHKRLDSFGVLPSYQNHSRVEPIFEPQVLYVYPPGKQLPLTHKDITSFCFPGGVEVNAVERTPSMSALNEILLGQEHLKQSDQSFVFRLQVADDSTLYGCCLLVEEIVDKPSTLLSSISPKHSFGPSMSRYILTTHRCYCILSRLPFFQLHFGVLNSIFVEERLGRLTQDITCEGAENIENESCGKEALEYCKAGSKTVGIFQNVDVNISKINMDNSVPYGLANDGSLLEGCNVDGQVLVPINHLVNGADPLDYETDSPSTKAHSTSLIERHHGENFVMRNHVEGRNVLNGVLPSLHLHQYESSESSCSFQGSGSEDRPSHSDIDDTETDEPSVSGRDDGVGDGNGFLSVAKENECGSLLVICEYYKLQCPSRGSTLRFHPLEHLHPLEYQRPVEAMLYVAGSTIDLRSCSSSLELAEIHSVLSAEEEANSLSTWAISCLCGSLRLEHVLMIFAAALLEKRIVFVCSNLGVLSACVLSVIPLIQPYRWQSLLMPILPDDMLDFLDAPVPYIVGVKNKTSEVQSKLNGAILVDANKNQVKSPSVPQLPKYRELFSSLHPYHAQLVGESFLARKRPVYQCTDVQIEAVRNFRAVLRSYMNLLCSNLRSHTITNVQSNNDKVSLLLKESFIDSFPGRDRPFMKLFVDTQLFSMHTDLVLSFIQKE